MGLDFGGDNLRIGETSAGASDLALPDDGVCLRRFCHGAMSRRERWQEFFQTGR